MYDFIRSKRMCKLQEELQFDIWNLKPSSEEITQKIEIRTELHSRKKEDLFRCWFHLIFPRNEVLSCAENFAEDQFTPRSEVESRSLDRNILNWQANNAPSLGPCFQDLLVPLSWHADPIHDSIRRSFPVDRRKERVYFAHYSLRRCKNHYFS